MHDEPTPHPPACVPVEDPTRLLVQLRALAGARGLGTLATAGALLVTVTDDELDIVRFSWRILQAGGGLVSRADIARIYGVSNSRAYKLSNQRHFPEPVGELSGTPFWLALEVKHYREQPPPSGRPAREKTS